MLLVLSFSYFSFIFLSFLLLNEFRAGSCELSKKSNINKLNSQTRFKNIFSRLGLKTSPWQRHGSRHLWVVLGELSTLLRHVVLHSQNASARDRSWIAYSQLSRIDRQRVMRPL